MVSICLKAGLTQANKESFDLSKNLVLFNGNCAHCVDPFEGDRYSIVWFTIGCHHRIGEEDRAKMAQLSMPEPSKDEDPYLLLRAPKGALAAKRAVTTGGKKSKALPPFRFWKKDIVEKQRRVIADKIKKLAKERASRRVAPENARSFYGMAERYKKWQKEGKFKQWAKAGKKPPKK